MIATTTATTTWSPCHCCCCRHITGRAEARASRGQGEARVRQCERRSAQNHDDNCNNDMIVAASLSSRCRASKGKEVVIVVAIRRDGGRE